MMLSVLVATQGVLHLGGVAADKALVGLDDTIQLILDVRLVTLGTLMSVRLPFRLEGIDATEVTARVDTEFLDLLLGLGVDGCNGTGVVLLISVDVGLLLSIEPFAISFSSPGAPPSSVLALSGKVALGVLRKSSSSICTSIGTPPLIVVGSKRCELLRRQVKAPSDGVVESTMAAEAIVLEGVQTPWAQLVIEVVLLRVHHPECEGERSLHCVEQEAVHGNVGRR